MDLQRFCHKSRAGGRLSTPFSHGDYTYATDGWMIVRVPRINDVPERDDAPGVDNLWWDHSALSDWTNPPKTDPSSAKKCSLCKGTGTVKDCPECDGDGEVIAVTGLNEYEAVCKTCDGYGATAGGTNTCDCCCGTGLNIETPVEWRDGHISGPLLAKISTLPGLQLSKHGNCDEGVRFRFDGGEGLLMPLRT